MALIDKLSAIADGIRAQIGGSATYTPAQMIQQLETRTWHQCPEAVRNYLAAVTYSSDDYSVSHIEEYAPSIAVASNAEPVGLTVGNCVYRNEIPNTVKKIGVGAVMPLDQLRWIKAATAANVRDLGGWDCDGGTVRYGLLLRGGNITAEDRNVLVNECSVKVELNLRGAAEAGQNHSVLGDDVRFVCADDYNWYSLENIEAWKTNIRCVFDAVIHGETVYFYCSAGADRTATLACVIEALLGMSQSDIDKDYELTCFYSGTDNGIVTRQRNNEQWQGLISQINTFAGSNFRDKAVTFIASLGFTAGEINAFRAAMIDGTPESVAPIVSNFSTSKVLSHVVCDNSASSVVQFRPYEANITPANGYVIDHVQITMGGVDITDLVWSGEKVNRYFAVSNILSNCGTNNVRNTVIAGQSYGAAITPEEAYTLEGAIISITMGGEDVSAYYSNGRIAIPNVTGEIVISISAVPSAVTEIPIVLKRGYTCSYTVGSSINIAANASYFICEEMSVSYGNTYKIEKASSTTTAFRFIGVDTNGIVTETCEGSGNDSYWSWTPSNANTVGCYLRSYTGAEDQFPDHMDII